MEYLTKKEKIYIRFCNLLGAKQFKKYWPVRGSCWNRIHIDKKNIIDLEDVINNANEYSRLHTEQSITTIIIIGLCALFDNTSVKQMAKYIPIIGIYHGYAFMIHHYNRIMAKAYLKKAKELKTNETKTNNVSIDQNCNSEISKIKEEKNLEINLRYKGYYVIRHTILHEIFLVFKDGNKCIEFLKYLGSYPEEEILENYNKDKCVNMYIKWKNSIHIK